MDRERPRHQSMFTNRWKRTEDLEEDEWFIPYKRRSAPQARLDQPQGGVGEMPNTTSTSVNMARPTRSFFGSGSGGSGSGSSHRRQKSTPIEDDSATRSRFFRRPVLPRSGSDGTLTRPSPSAIPSTTSVPTGLAAPKMLFSPMMREIRDDTQPAAQYDNNHPPSSYHVPRQRTVSAPKHTSSHVYDKIDQRRWAAPTMCDMLVFPRPHITPLSITPPASPEKLPSVFDGLSVADKVDRDKERDEWHKYVEKRARGKSFRIGSVGNGLDEGGGIFKSRARSASAGAGPSRKPSRKSEKSRYQDPNSAPPLTTVFNFGKPRSSRETQHHDDLEDDPFRHAPTEAERYKTAHHQHAKSSPDLSATHQHRNRVRVAPRPPWDDDGVIVIGPGRSRSGLSKSTTKPDFTKPLPPLPAEYTLQYRPSSPFKPFATKDNSRSSSPAQLPPSRLQPAVPAPTAGPSRLNNEVNSADARAMIAKQHQRAITKRAFNSPRPRQHRDSEVSVSTTSQYSQGSQRASTLSAVSPLRRMTAMEEAITRSRANSGSSNTASGMQSSTTSKASAATTVTATPLLRSQIRDMDRSGQTTPRMRQVSESQTPSPRNQNHEDFKVCLIYKDQGETDAQGLFFRTPQEQQGMRFQATNRMMPTQFLEKPNGLGFDMDDDRRQSASDDSTMEISTPVTAPKGTFLVYGDEMTELREPTLPLAAAFQKTSPDTSPPSRRGSHDSQESDGKHHLTCIDTS